MSELIFSTVHGSMLYGLAHPGSDRDVYYVYEGKGHKLKQSTDGVDDSVRGTLDAFVHRAYTGSHQSVEALFSNVKEWEPGMYEKYGAYVEGITITGGDVFAKYERTIKRFCHEDFKRRRHAARLTFNLQMLRTYGRFDPTLTEFEVELCDMYATNYKGAALWDVLITG